MSTHDHAEYEATVAEFCKQCEKNFSALSAELKSLAERLTISRLDFTGSYFLNNYSSDLTRNLSHLLNALPDGDLQQIIQRTHPVYALSDYPGCPVEELVPSFIRFVNAKLYVGHFFDAQQNITRIESCYAAGETEYRRRDSQPFTQDDMDALNNLNDGSSGTYTEIVGQVGDTKVVHKWAWEW